MPTSRRYSFAFPFELADQLERVVPPRQRNAFVANAVRSQLNACERESLQSEMEECAGEMYDEILRIEREFHPLEEELHRQI